MIKLRLSALLMITCFFLGSCRQSMTKEELIAFLKDPENGLLREKHIDGLKFQLLYFPAGKLNKLQKDLGKEESEYQYFILKIKDYTSRSPLHNRSNSEKDYLNRLYYVQTGLKNDFYMLCDGVETLCVNLDYEDDHNMMDEMKLVIAFKKTKTQGDIIIRYDDKLFGEGLLNFKFKSKDLLNIPDLKI